MTDLRIPIGLFFLLLGILLETVARAKAPLTDVRVNSFAGAVMLLFGAVMLLLARRAAGRGPR